MLAVAAAAVGVVFFLRRGAVLAMAILVVAKLGLVRFQGAIGHGDLFSLRGEGDLVNGMVGIGERAVAEIDCAGAEEAIEGVGGLEVDAPVVERLGDEHEVDLEGGAVFGEVEGERGVDAVGVGLGVDLGEGALDDLVVSAVEGRVDGGLGAASARG